MPSQKLEQKALATLLTKATNKKIGALKKRIVALDRKVNKLQKSVGAGAGASVGAGAGAASTGANGDGEMAAQIQGRTLGP